MENSERKISRTYFNFERFIHQWKESIIWTFVFMVLIWSKPIYPELELFRAVLIAISVIKFIMLYKGLFFYFNKEHYVIEYESFSTKQEVNDLT